MSAISTINKHLAGIFSLRWNRFAQSASRGKDKRSVLK